MYKYALTYLIPEECNMYNFRLDGSRVHCEVVADKEV